MLEEFQGREAGMEAEEMEMVAVELVLELVAKESMEMAVATEGLAERAAAAVRGSVEREAAAVRGSEAKAEKAAGAGSEEGLISGAEKGLGAMEEYRKV